MVKYFSSTRTKSFPFMSFDAISFHFSLVGSFFHCQSIIISIHCMQGFLKFLQSFPIFQISAPACAKHHLANTKLPDCYGKWTRFTSDLSINHGIIFHMYVKFPEGKLKSKNSFFAYNMHTLADAVCKRKIIDFKCKSLQTAQTRDLQYRCFVSKEGTATNQTKKTDKKDPTSHSGKSFFFVFSMFRVKQLPPFSMKSLYGVKSLRCLLPPIIWVNYTSQNHTRRWWKFRRQETYRRGWLL